MQLATAPAVAETSLSVRVAAAVGAALLESAALAAAEWGNGRLFLRLAIPAQILLMVPAAILLLRHSAGQRRWDVRRLAVPVLLCAFAAAFGAALYLSRGVVIPDESAYRFQARIFRSGAAWAPALHGASQTLAIAPDYARFSHHVMMAGKWYGKYPPLWPAALAVAQILHVEGVANVLLAVLLIFMTFRFARRFSGAPAGWIAALFCAACPYFFSNAITPMSHMFTGVLLAGAVWLMLDDIEFPSVRRRAGAWSLIAAAFWARPFTAVVFGAVYAVALAIRYRRSRGVMLSSGALAACTALLTAVLFLAYNRLYTGNALLSPYAAARGAARIVELKPDLGQMIRNIFTQTGWEYTHTAVFIGVPLLVLAAYGAWTMRSAGAWTLGALFPALVLAYTIQPETSSSIAGDRYYFEAFFAVAALAAGGLTRLFDRYGTGRGAQIAVLLLWTGTQILPFTIVIGRAQYRAAASIALRAGLADVAAPGSVVFLAPSRRLAPKHFNINEADWQHAPVLYLLDPGAERRNGIARACGRSAWQVISLDDASMRPVVLARSTIAP